MLLLAALVAAAASSSNNTDAAAAASVPRHTVSGLSSGASATLNHLIAFSSAVDGAAVVAGSPYGCQILPDSNDVCGMETLHPAAYYDWTTL